VLFPQDWGGDVATISVSDDDFVRLHAADYA
jgi:hypothetical protein